MSGELISREALERIIQRAAELQAGERDIGDGLTKDEVLALGKDVGIPSRYLQQAILEEQTLVGTEREAGAWAWLAGPRTLSADRVVPGERADLERALTRWMDEGESLQIKRRYPDRITWEPKAGAFATIQRALGSKGRRFALAAAVQVTAQIIPLEAGFCHARLTADVRGSRARRLQGAAVVGTLGVLATAAFLAPFGALALLPAAVLFPTAAAILRHHRQENERVQVAIEQVLDRLEHGELRADRALPGPRPSTFFRIADEIRRTFQA